MVGALRGTIRRRILVNYRARPECVQRLLPAPFRPKLHSGHAVVGICLIRLEQVRPSRLPEAFGLSSENAAHRIAIEWSDEGERIQEGVFVLRRDTASLFNRLAGGRLFPGEQNSARFDVQDDGDRVELAMCSNDGVALAVAGRAVRDLPETSIFYQPEESSAFFESGSFSYSASSNPNRVEALSLHMDAWSTTPFELERAESSFFDDENRFPKGTITLDHALIMRDLKHEWHAEDSRAIGRSLSAPVPTESKRSTPPGKRA